MSRSYLEYLYDIYSSIREVFDFVGEMNYQEFAEDRKTINAVLRSLEVVGEAAKHVPDKLKYRYPNIPWKRMCGMRDKLIHEYHGVDYEMVWLVIREDLVSLEKGIDAIIKETENT